MAEPLTSSVEQADRSFDLTRDDLWDAWLRVQENGGCGGVDGVTIEAFAETAERRLRRLLESVEKGTYRCLPLLEIEVEKSPGSGGLRRLLVPAVADRVLQTAAAHLLSRSFEEEFLDASFAYRPGRSVDRAIARVRQWRDRGYRQVVRADIEGFFDHIDQGQLLGMLAARRPSQWLLDPLQQWVKASYWDGRRVRAVEAGIAQGSPLSPLLANFFLQPFDLQLEQTGDHLVRYGDDFLVLCLTPEAAAEALQLAGEYLAREKLRLSLEKTDLTSFEAGFHFLGAFFLHDEVYVPWKREHLHGKLFFMAKPMPRALLARYEQPERRTAVAQALRRAGVESLEPAAPQPISPGRLDVSYLYLTEQGAVLRKSGDRFLVEKDDQVELDLPYHKLESVLIFGNVQVTTQAMAELLDKGITVGLFSRQGRFRGSLDPPRGKNVLLRLAQFEAYKDEPRALQIARATVQAKISNGLEVLDRYASRQAQPEGFAAARTTLAAALEAAGAAQNVPGLLGIEGTAAHAQFNTLMLFNRSPFKWPGRVRHPATDPLNALLSLSYTLLMNELSGLLSGLGLDPYLGYLHQIDYGRPSLALDLLEPFRHPVADRLVLMGVNKGMFQPDDFQKAVSRETAEGEQGLYLAAEAMKRYFAQYEHWMLAQVDSQQPTVDSKGNACEGTSIVSAGGKDKNGKPQAGQAKERAHSVCFRDLLRAEVERFAATLRGKRDWVPYRFGKPPEEAVCDTSSVTI
jgi:CRISPR-associated protein Cas1